MTFTLVTGRVPKIVILTLVFELISVSTMKLDLFYIFVCEEDDGMAE